MPEFPPPRAPMRHLFPLPFPSALAMCSLLLIPVTAARAQTTLYSAGDPTDAEQVYLEMINRARANPTAEGVRLATTTDANVLASYTQYGVNLTMLQNEFAALAVRPPLAMNAKLLAAARKHTRDMYDNAFQDHTGSDGSDLAARLVAVGYSRVTAAENVYAGSKSCWHGHAAFNADWGSGGTGGMQKDRSHRANIHGDYREVGLGVIDGSSGTFGPQFVTQDFANPVGPQPFVTGVAYSDLNGNGFYDAGEGIGGLTVTVSGAAYHAVTTASGGYAVPVPASANKAVTRTVAFAGLGISYSVSTTIATTNLNVKVDCKPVYSGPVATGPTAPEAGKASLYAFTTSGGATGYEWVGSRLSPVTADPAESLTRVLVGTSPSYSPLSTSIKYSGSSAYRMTHVYGLPQKDEILTYPGTFMVGNAASLQFRSRLTGATTDQKAKVQMSTDGGMTWSDLWVQAGSGDSGETSFQLRTIDLSAHAGKLIRLRFNYSYLSGYYSYGTSVGWYVDDVVFANLTEAALGTVAPVPAGTTGFSFTPPAAGQYQLNVRPIVSGRAWPWGPALAVTASAPAGPSYSLWAAQQESALGLPPGSLSDPNGDPNGDGVNNLLAYALGLPPMTGSAQSIPRPVMRTQGFCLDYPEDTAKSDITLVPQASRDLTRWFAPGQSGAPTGFSDEVLTSSGSVQQRRATIPTSAGQGWFLRLCVMRP